MRNSARGQGVSSDTDETDLMLKIAKAVSSKLVRKVPWLCIDELTQAAFAEMWDRRFAYAGMNGAGLDHYLRTIAFRAVHREARARVCPVTADCWRAGPTKGLRGVQLEEVETDGDEELHERADRVRKVRARLTEILPRQDAVFILTVFGFDLPHDELAMAFDMTRHAVHQRTYRLRNVLKQDPVLRELLDESA